MLDIEDIQVLFKRFMNDYAHRYVSIDLKPNENNGESNEN